MFLALLVCVADGCDSGDDVSFEETDGVEETDGPAALAECSAPDPEIDASYSLVGENWEDLDTASTINAWYAVEESCIVLSAEVDGGQWVTELDCGGEPVRTAMLSIASPANGTISWSAGEMLTLAASGNVDGFGGTERIQLLRGDDVLVHVLRGSSLEGGAEGLIESLGATSSTEECGAPALDDFDASDIGNLALHFERGDASTAIVSGHRGSIAIDAGTLEIDVAEATSGWCCHGTLVIDVLMRVASPV